MSGEKIQGGYVDWTDHLRFFGFQVCSSAILVSVAIVYGKSLVLAILIGTFLSLAVVIAGATITFAHSSNCGKGCIVPVIECSILTGIVA